ncbi:MAG: ABC transporter permease [Burkholderiales bacterium]|nr:ABC transporter permease [Burkholderiales bacterium]
MSTVRLLWAYLSARPLTTLLTVLLVALGVATTTIVTLVTNQAEERLVRDAAGIDLVVGAKGSPLQLVLAGVYHLDVPPGNVPVAALAELRANRLVAQAIPLSLGDSFRGFRIVGTEPAFLELHGAKLARGEAFAAPMQAVIGARVAAETGLAPGARFVGSHGLAPGGPEHGEDPFTVVGVLAPTGGVLDRLVLTPLESVWLAHEGEPADEDERRILEEARDITLALVRYASPLAAATLPRAINASDRLQAASPAFESARLFRLAGVGIDGLRAFGVLLLATAALSVFVALFQALSDRRRELALMRLLGASPARLFALLLGEGLALTAIGIVLGMAVGHGALEAAGRVLARHGEWTLTGADFDTIELAYAAGALLLGGLAAAVPAWLAARTPLAGALADD